LRLAANRTLAPRRGRRAVQAPPTDTGAVTKHVIAVFGPTAVGKTEVAIALADELRARGERPVAVSADALQVYRGLEILTGVPQRAERARLEHRLISFVPVDTRFSVGEYATLAHAEIDGLLAEGATPIVVGGTGLYLRAALAQLELRPPPPEGVREHWEAELRARGPEALHAQLTLLAPWAAGAIEPRDRHRVVRALELHDQGALESSQGPNRLWTADTRHPTRLAGLIRDRDELYARIEARVDAMVQRGALEEVRRAHAAGASETARAALGFDELLAGDIDAMKRRTRNYARRQLTWMRKLPDVTVLNMTEHTPELVAERLLR
jgi:tRNA dimethylallyltransferase